MYAVLGDVVGSRRLPDRGVAQQRLGAVFADVNARVPGLQPLEATVGDEFQGGYASLGQATGAALLVRLELLPDVDVRCAIGVGETTVYDEERSPLLQDGPAWWAAREALEWMAAPRRAAVRTWVVGPEAEAEAVALANAH